MARTGKDKLRTKRSANGEGAPGVLTSATTSVSGPSALQRLNEERKGGLRWGARIRNYFTTGLLIVGPLTITVYIIWTVVNLVDAWIKPWIKAILPQSNFPDLPFAVPGIGLIFAVAALTIVGALAANLLGRTLISFGELMLDRMPIVRNVYRAMKQLFEGVLTATGSEQAFQKVGLIQFPSQGIWSIVFVTNEAAGEIGAHRPAGDQELITVFMPTGVVPPTGFICFVPRNNVKILDMSAEDAAKIIVSGGMVIPEHNAEFADLAKEAVRKRGDARAVNLETGKVDEE